MKISSYHLSFAALGLFVGLTVPQIASAQTHPLFPAEAIRIAEIFYGDPSSSYLEGRDLNSLLVQASEEERLEYLMYDEAEVYNFNPPVIRFSLKQYTFRPFSWDFARAHHYSVDPGLVLDNAFHLSQMERMTIYLNCETKQYGPHQLLAVEHFLPNSDHPDDVSEYNSSFSIKDVKRSPELFQVLNSDADLIYLQEIGESFDLPPDLFIPDYSSLLSDAIERSPFLDSEVEEHWISFTDDGVFGAIAQRECPD